ncbi:hypothetical protein VB776_17635 [Arcicella sp. DC2W]|uniref:Lipoprotein n=1 Tax=Arcicella gelida TaxID=2984195 RepID=A0ABU5S8H2_9BACT|nr:hypothetical protein [Arcicella sp. DC2W]MEA5404761.1 hypothetical protein [Arcicella sp. DC2W]
MQTIRLTFASIFAVFVAVSCTSQKAVISQNQAEKANIEIAKIEPQRNTSMIEAAPKKQSPTMYASTAEVIQVEEASQEQISEVKKEKINALLEKVIAQKNENKTVTSTHKANFVEKLIIKKLEKKMKKSAQPVDFHSWNSFLKLGVILLGIGIVLAIVGLGTVGGLAAFIGILFTILGILQEV